MVGIVHLKLKEKKNIIDYIERSLHKNPVLYNYLDQIIDTLNQTDIEVTVIKIVKL